MERTTSPGSILLSLLFVLASGVFAYYQYRCPKFANRIFRQYLTRNYTPGSDVEFEWDMAASGRYPDGGEADMYRYRCSDCIKVEKNNIRFEDATKAAAHFRGDLGRAVRVIDQSAPKGERMNPADSPRVVMRNDRGHFEILRLKDNRIIQIESASLPHALELERRSSR